MWAVATHGLSTCVLFPHALGCSPVFAMQMSRACLVAVLGSRVALATLMPREICTFLPTHGYPTPQPKAEAVRAGPGTQFPTLLS